MILTDSAILKEIQAGNITLQPYDPKCVGSNSYDVHLSSRLAVYRSVCLVNGNEAMLYDKHEVLDSKQHNATIELKIPEEGFVLQPGILYLGSTIEYTATNHLVPYLEGKSSMGRLGIKVHVTAGKGDVGFRGHWTLEIEVTHPVRVYPGMAVAQLTYFRTEGFCINPYNKKKGAKYNNTSDKPVASRNNENFRAQGANEAFKERFKDSGIAGLPNDDDSEFDSHPQIKL